MAKQTFAARTFAAGTFASGTFRGIGIAPPPPPPPHMVVVPPYASPRELDFSDDWQFWLGDIDLSNDWQFWMNTETVILSTSYNPDAMVCTIDVCKRRALTRKELAASRGAYTADDVLFLIPQTFLPNGFRPQPGSIVTDADGVNFTALDVGGRKRDRNNQYQTWALTCRDLVLAEGLADAIDIQRPTITFDAAGGKLRAWPEDGKGSVPYKSLAARVQLLTQEFVEERGIGGFKGTHAVIVGRQVTVTAEDRVKVTLDGATVYLSIIGQHNPQRIDELPVLDCTLAP